MVDRKPSWDGVMVSICDAQLVGVIIGNDVAVKEFGPHRIV